jgi:hypothetical protein
MAWITFGMSTQVLERIGANWFIQLRIVVWCCVICEKCVRQSFFAAGIWKLGATLVTSAFRSIESITF